MNEKYTKYDIIVIGAGPAGLLTSIKLKEKKYSIAIFEKENSIGKNAICGGACDYKTISDIANELKSLNIVDRVNIFYNYKRILNIKIPKVAIFDRREFDNVLYKKAKDMGVDIFLNSRVNNIIKSGKYFKIKINSKYFIAKYIIMATGPMNNILKEYNVGFSLKKNFAIAGRTLIELNNNNEFAFYFSNDLYGYNWIFTNKKHTNIGHGVFNKKGDIKYLFNKFIKRANMNIKKDITYSIIPLEISKRLSINNIAFIGDAAGMINPITGGGLRLIYFFSDILVKTIDKSIKNKKTLSYYYDKMCKRTLIYWVLRILGLYVKGKNNVFIVFIFQFLILAISNKYIDKSK